MAAFDEPTPETLGAFILAGWRLRGVCTPCAIGVPIYVDLQKALETHGEDYPIADLKAEQRCVRCGGKTWPFAESPRMQELARSMMASLGDTWGKSRRR